MRSERLVWRRSAIVDGGIKAPMSRATPICNAGEGSPGRKLRDVGATRSLSRRARSLADGVTNFGPEELSGERLGRPARFLRLGCQLFYSLRRQQFHAFHGHRRGSAGLEDPTVGRECSG